MSAPDWAEEEALELFGCHRGDEGNPAWWDNHPGPASVEIALRAARDRGIEEAASNLELLIAGSVQEGQMPDAVEALKAIRSLIVSGGKGLPQ